MGLQDELSAEVGKIFRSSWSETDGRVVPDVEDLSFGNVAKKFDDAVVLYADMSYSTDLVDQESWSFAAEVYKAFLFCAGKIIRSEGGEITAYDGDRIMAVYLGDRKNSAAAITALKINHVKVNIINPLLKQQYPSKGFLAQHVVGIDRSTLRATRTGVRGDNDLVWVGSAANHAAKLSSFSPEAASWITAEVYDMLNKDAKYANGQSMWEERTWIAMGNRRVYRSIWMYPV